jgi:ABC-2 type transport system permease protein
MTSIPTRVVAPHREARVRRELRSALMVWRRDLVRLRRNSVRIVFGLAQPVGFLIVFSIGVAGVVSSQALPEQVSYKVFIFPGVLAMTIISSALIACVSIVWDREFGFMREMLVAPVSRVALIAGKTLGGSTIAMLQGLIILVLAPLVGVDLGAARLVALFAVLALMAVAITTLGIAVASSVDRIQTLQTVMAVLIQPLIFTSGALFPIDELPRWLTVLCYLNPATYGVDLARRALLGEGFALHFGDWVVPVWFDLAVLVTFTAVMFAIATRLVAREMK